MCVCLSVCLWCSVPVPLSFSSHAAGRAERSIAVLIHPSMSSLGPPILPQPVGSVRTACLVSVTCQPGGRLVVGSFLRLSPSSMSSYWFLLCCWQLFVCTGARK